MERQMLAARHETPAPARLQSPASPVPLTGGPRPRIDGKFLAVGDQRLWVRGVTYGTFAPDEQGCRCGTPDQVERDFAAMAEQGVNAVRTYVAPPPWFLDAAMRHGLWVMPGLPWEQHVAFLDERRRPAAIERRVRDQAAACAGHPAILCYAVGNEIPTPIVRWHGRRRVERFLERLCDVVRAEDPSALLTYVNYPSTEYLQLPFVDLLSFNVYLDDAASVSRYLARLQNLAAEKPLLLAELGSDSQREGLAGQARTLGSQVDAAFAAGCAGTFVFAWTDEWHRGESPVVDWDFGVTDRERRPKPALKALRTAYAGAGAAAEEDPFVSVVVCTYNGAATLGDCLAGATALRYPSYEVIVVDDASTDASAEIAAGFDVRLIRSENRQGLSAARNIGLEAAKGDIVAYIDDDAYPDPDWLRFLAISFRTTGHAAVGGPNLPPDEDPSIAACVANAPGGPVHVLVSDSEAEHIPGCNMAYRRDELAAIGGFDPQFRAAGDDVDVCWRLRERGATLGFHAAAVVWHRRRSSIRRYWRQQLGYGKAEALLERKWPERYNRRGHLTWAGRLYDRASASALRPVRIYHGTWGTGAFQPREHAPRSALAELASAPEWYLVLAGLAVISVLGLLWSMLLVAVPLLAGAAAASLFTALGGCLGADLGRHGTSRTRRLALRAVVALLHLLQPAARLSGRLSAGLAPWRAWRIAGVVVPLRRVKLQWFETWRPAKERVAGIEAAARRAGVRIARGGPYDRWDLELAGGAIGSVRLLIAVEEHGAGRQLVRCRVSPHVARSGIWTAVVFLGLAGLAGLAHRWLAAGVLAALLAAIVVLVTWECASAEASALSVLERSTGRLPQEAAVSDRHREHVMQAAADET